MNVHCSVPYKQARVMGIHATSPHCAMMSFNCYFPGCWHTDLFYLTKFWQTALYLLFSFIRETTVCWLDAAVMDGGITVGSVN